MRYMHNSGTSPMSDRNPVLGTRNGIDIKTADRTVRPQSNMFSFFINFELFTINAKI